MLADVLDPVLERVDALPLGWLLVAVGVAMALEASVLIGIVVPGDLVVVGAAASLGTPAELVLLVLVVAAGSVVGEVIGWLVGRRWGPALRASRLGRRLGPERWDRAGALLRRRGGRAVVCARFLAAVHAVTPLVAGAAGMPFRRFVAWCAVGSLLWGALVVGVGAALGRFTVLGAAVLLAGGAVVLTWRRRRAGAQPTSLNGAPVGSTAAASRPYGVSSAGIAIEPPSEVTCASAASTSATWK